MKKKTGVIFEEIRKSLRDADFESADFEATQILKSAGADIGFDSELSEEQIDKVMLMTKRRLNHEPLQYILGEWEFMGFPIKVGEGVLIPRQDTESVTEKAIDLIKGISNPLIYDLCAGSGCIGIALAKLCGGKVRFFEKSQKAIKYLEENAGLNKLKNFSVTQCDVLDSGCHYEKADIIISNPPYIKTETINTLSEEVKSEPVMALDGGKNGIDFYDKIPKIWKPMLKDGGIMIFEIGYDQGKQVQEIMRTEGYADVQCAKDLCGNDRMVWGTLKYSESIL